MVRIGTGLICTLVLVAALIVGNDTIACAVCDQGAKSNDVVIELFYRSDKEQSQQAITFLNELAERRPGLVVKKYDILEDKPALTRLWDLSKQFGYEKAGVPTFYFCNSLKVGFSMDYTAPLIENYLTIRAFVRQGCPHCRDAKLFLDKMVRRWPALNVKYYDVVADTNARNEMQNVANKYKVRVATLPCIEVAGRAVIGYQTDAITGRKIESYFKDRSFKGPNDSTNDGSVSKENGDLGERLISLHGIGFLNQSYGGRDIVAQEPFIDGGQKKNRNHQTSFKSPMKFRCPTR